MADLAPQAQQRPPETSGLALAGFIVSLMAVPLTAVPMPVVLGGALSLAAFIMSLTAHGQIRRSQGALSGRRLAVVSMTISAVWLIVCFCFALMMIGAFMFTSTHSTFELDY